LAGILVSIIGSFLALRKGQDDEEFKAKYETLLEGIN
jgi:hypothetical protein